MRVIIDTTPMQTRHKGRGVGTYISNLKNNLKSVSGMEFIFSDNPQNENADVIHHPFFDLFSNTLPLIKKYPTVITIHDVIPLIFPKNFPPGTRGSINLKLQKLALRSVTKIITDSNSSKDDIIKYLHQSPNKIETIYLGKAEVFQKAPATKISNFKAKHQLPEKFISYVGDINYNKNLPRLIEAVSLSNNTSLAIATRADINSSIPEARTINFAINKYRMKNRIRFLNLDTDTELAIFYSASSLYVQPSLYEGFGLPILEAMACETPVACSNSSSLPEIGLDTVRYFEPTKTRDIKRVIDESMVLNKKAREKLLTRAKKRADNFTWKKTAQHTINVYKSVMKTVYEY